MDKLRPHYKLSEVKAAFADPTTLNRSFTSKRDANTLQMDDEAVVSVIQALGSADFDKSMTSLSDYKIWQDVYKPIVNGTELYGKFTIDLEKALVLISFKVA